MAGALRRRWTQWWHARHRPCERLLLTQRNVYILPTAAGGMLALTVLVMLIASINFQLNMGYLLTFLLAGSATASTACCACSCTIRPALRAMAWA